MDLAEKRQLIESIDDEVNVLHPLLQDLLQKIANVTHVEYTHGPNEMGADFVVERHDPAIRLTSYIGIVAKTRKVLQNTDEVERQIRECGHPRTIRNGEREVRLPEIWVISSKGFSHNAKTKIIDEYQKQKIHFFDADWIVGLLDEHNPYYWDQLPNATGIYLDSLNRRMKVMDAQTAILSTLSGATPYIELDIELHDADHYSRRRLQKKAHIVNFVEEVQRNRISVLQADMGFGKSREVRRIAAHFATPSILRDAKLLPCFLTFTQFVQSQFTDLDSFLRTNIGTACFDEAVAAGCEFLIILDGIDEVESDICEVALAKITQAVRAASNVRVLLTTRPYKLLAKIPEFAQSAKTYEIRPIAMRKLVKFLEDVFQQLDLPRRLYQDLAKSHLFKQLPQNPIAASLLSSLVSQNKQELPSNLTELYAKSVDFMLGRWDERRALATERLFVACQRLSRLIARHMIDNKLIYISQDEVRQRFEEFITQRSMGITTDEACDYLFKRSSLFGTLDGTVFFRHRSFAEYLYALDGYELRNLSINDTAYNPYWLNIFFFYIGLRRECPEELEALVNLGNSSLGTRLIQVLQIGKYFLAGSQTPYAVVTHGVGVIFQRIAKLYLEVKGGALSSAFGRLSEMQLLSLFANLVKYSFGYDFFSKALQDAFFPICESDIEEEKVYAMFFVACALGEIGEVGGFALLLENRRTEELPLPISLAVEFETRGEKSFSKHRLVKQHEKTLRKLLSSARTVKGGTAMRLNKLDDLFEKPIRPDAEVAQLRS